MASASARRYARAIFEIAEEGKEIEPWAERLRILSALLANPELRAVLENPSISIEDRQGVIGGFAALGLEGQNLAKLLIAAHRTQLVGEILEEFELMTDEAAGRVRATATAAVELSKVDTDRLAKDLSIRLGKEVRLEVRVDPKIIGGLVIRVGDRVVDASLATRLQQLRRQLAVS